MRCPDCNKFASFDTEADPEGDLDISSEGMISGEIHRGLPCADCGTELKAYDFSVDKDLNDILTLPEDLTAAQKACEHAWAWEDAPIPAVSPNDRMEDKDRHGNKIKHARFMKHMYGIEVTGEVKCQRCGVIATYDFTEEEAASAFDEVV